MNKKLENLGAKINLPKEDTRKFTRIGLSGFLALAISVFTAGWTNSHASGMDSQSNKKGNPLQERCNMKPDRGPCKGAFGRFYFDGATKKCTQFMYGGCGGVVPFETQEQCDKACADLGIAEDPVNSDPYPVTKYGGISIRDFKDAK